MKFSGGFQCVCVAYMYTYIYVYYICDTCMYVQCMWGVYVHVALCRYVYMCLPCIHMCAYACVGGTCVCVLHVCVYVVYAGVCTVICVCSPLNTHADAEGGSGVLLCHSLSSSFKTRSLTL